MAARESGPRVISNDYDNNSPLHCSFVKPTLYEEIEKRVRVVLNSQHFSRVLTNPRVLYNCTQHSGQVFSISFIK
jgi:hypothetical protein